MTTIIVLDLVTKIVDLTVVKKGKVQLDLSHGFTVNGTSNGITRKSLKWYMVRVDHVFAKTQSQGL